MTHIPVRDQGNKQTSFLIDTFAGLHYGVGLTDQWKGYAYILDMIIPEQKLTIRQGCIKNSTTGQTGSIDGVFNFQTGADNLIGLIHDGNLDLVSINSNLE